MVVDRRPPEASAPIEHHQAEKSLHTKEKAVSQRARRPAGRQAQAALFKVVNVPMRAILGLPFPTPLGQRLMLVFHTGRKTGKHYRQPVSYVRDGDTLLTPGGGRWTRNLRTGEPVRVRLRGRDQMARPDLVRDPDDVERMLGVMTAANPGLRRFVRIPTGADGRLDRTSLTAAVDNGFRIVRWYLAPD
jgi:deazaflavin-dependent oxidoreductase (nitroreductase family)